MQPAITHHYRHHRRDGWLPRVEDCWRCQEAKAKCEYKNVYRNRSEADEAATRRNIALRWWPDECKYGYRCPWCSQWHLTTACRVGDDRRVDKLWRRWMRRTHQKIKDEDYDYAPVRERWGLPDTG